MRWISSLLLASLKLLILSADISFAEVDDSHLQEVSNWGRQIRHAIDSNLLTALEVNGVAVKKNPSRHVEVRQYLTTSKEVRMILEPATTILEKQEFQFIDTHNLSTLRVLFRFELASICPPETTQFVIVSTAKDLFYVGCASKDPTNKETENLMRIWSPALDKALRKWFPTELYESGSGLTIEK